MKTRVFLLAAVGLGPLALAAAAADWPQWRGPNRDGISRETGLLKEWPKEGPKLLWQVKEIGDGYSTPAVVGDRLYLLSNKGMDNEFVQARAVKDGSEVWTTTIGKVGPNRGPQYPGARSTPTVDGERLYALGSDGDLACLETATGQVQWAKNLRKEFGGRIGSEKVSWAYSESPLIDGDVLVCTPGGEGATLVALNKTTGEIIWKSDVPAGDMAAYSSVIAVEAGGVKQYVQLLEKGVVGVDAKAGKFLWRYDESARGSPANIPTPVAGAGFVYSSTGRGGGGLVKLTPSGGGITAEQVYLSRELPTSIGGSVLLGEHLYGTTGKGLVCAEFATGQVKWQDECVGAGAVLYADGRLYVRGEKTCQVALVEATPEAYREKGRFTPPGHPDRTSDRIKAWAYPVVANGRLYIRDQGQLWCYDVKAGAAAAR
jgi:outer membrane protein assembly factor BamB